MIPKREAFMISPIVLTISKSLESKRNFPNAASLPAWLEWAFWLSPLTYAEIGASVNEFLAPRWQKVKAKLLNSVDRKFHRTR